jgi:hypothetical protein
MANVRRDVVCFNELDWCYLTKPMGKDIDLIYNLNTID